MQKQKLWLFLLLQLLLPVVLFGCSQPTTTPPAVTPTAVTVTEQPTAVTNEQPTTVPVITPTQPIDQPTAVPVVTPTVAISPTAVVAPQTIDWAPQVVFATPRDGEPALLNGAITIRFDQPMDQASVANALLVSNETQSADGTLTWTRPDTLVFTPNQALERKQRYTVKIDKTAQGINGKPLADTVSFDFSTIGFLEVSQITPANNTDNVEADAAITVIFNRPVVPLVTTAEQDKLPNPITISPAIEGKGTWVSTSIYRFQPTGEWAGGTQYTVTVVNGLQDITGGLLAQDVTTSFTTAKPRVVQFSPELYEQVLGVTPTITITFNMPMDRASTEGAITLDPAAPVRFSWQEDSRAVGLTPSENLPLGTTFKINVATTALSANGAMSLEKEASGSFQSYPYPRVESTYPNSENPLDSYSMGYIEGVSVWFVSPMNFETLKNGLTIDPAPAEIELIKQGENGILAKFKFNYLTTYTVTISADAADIFGNKLGEPYTWSFDTPAPPPILVPNLPNRFAQLSTLYPTNIDLLYSDTKSGSVKLYSLGGEVSPKLLLQYDSTDGSTGSLIQEWPLEFTELSGVYPLSLANGGTLPTGIYRLKLALPDSEQEAQSSYWQNHDVIISVVDTNIVIKETPQFVHAWVTDLATGAPAAGRTVKFSYFSWDNPQTVQFAEGTSDANGLITVEKNYKLDGYGFDYSVIAMTGVAGEAGFGMASSLQNQSVDPYSFGVYATLSREGNRTMYMHTDRPLYRPNDTVYARGWIRLPNYGRYTVPEPMTLQMSLYNYDGIDPFEQKFDVPVDANGNFSVEYLLPDSAPLGNYYLSVNNQALRFEQGQGISFVVGQFRKPEILVKTTPARPAALRGESVDVTVSAEYFFGGGAPNLNVTWQLYSDPYRYDSWQGDLYYAFDDSGFAARMMYVDPFSAPSSYFGDVVLEGFGVTDANGNLVVNIPANLLDAYDPGSRTVTLQANVVDTSGSSVSSQASIIMHAADWYVGIASENYVVQTAQENKFSVIATDWDGKTVANAPVEVVFYQREWVAKNRDDNYGISWETKDTEISRTSLTTDGNGQAIAPFTADKAGSYVAKATITDSNGRTNNSEAELWVYGTGAQWRVDQRDRKMGMVVDKTEYRVGETASILVQSPFSNPVQAWLTIERGEVKEQRLITLSGQETLQLPITADYAPNVFVSLTAIKSADSSEKPWPDIRLGVAELIVNPEQLLLNVAITPDNTQPEPGDTINYTIQVSDVTGKGVSADVSVALVDLALLTLKKEELPTLGDAFYHRQPYRSQTTSGLFMSGEGLEAHTPRSPLGGFGGGGGGGDANADMAFSPTAAMEESDSSRSNSKSADEGAASVEVRSDFRDTAYWQALVTTNAEGNATVSIKLPDNVTTWRMAARAVSAETLVGQTTNDLTSTKLLIVRPVTPRFFTFGDDVQLGAIINNKTAADLQTTVTLSATGVTLSGSAEQQITVPANGSQLVRWPVKVEDVRNVDLTFIAVSGDLSDASKPTVGNNADRLIPVYRYNAEDIVATAGVLDQDERRVEAVILPNIIDSSLGNVTLRLNPSLAAAILDSLDVIEREPYDYQCAYTFLYHLMPNATAAIAIRELNLDKADLLAKLDATIPSDIAEIVRLQREDGGWGFCLDSSEPSVELTADMVLALTRAQRAGYEVSADVLTRAIQYLTNNLKTTVKTKSDANFNAYLIYVLAEAGQDVNSSADALLASGRDLLAPYAKGLMISALNKIGRTDEIQALLSDLNNSVSLSATGAFWEEDDAINLYSQLRGTAVIIQALSAVDAKNPLLDSAVRWLMEGRRARVWPGFYDTTWAISALSDYMRVTGELNANYTYQLYVNNGLQADGGFNSGNIATTNVVNVPVGGLQIGEPNFFDFRKSGTGRLYYTAHLDAFLSADSVQAVDRGFSVTRTYYDAACDAEKEVCQPLTAMQSGKKVRVELTIIATDSQTFVRVEDPLPAGADAINPNLDTSEVGLDAGYTGGYQPPYRWGYWGWWVFNDIDFRDEKVVFTADYLPSGTYQYTYYIEAVVPGTYQVMPTIAKAEFRPEVFGRANGMIFTVTP